MPLAFYALGRLGLMTAKFSSAKWVLAGILLAAGAVALAPGVVAQTASTVTKRKVKSKVVPEYPQIAQQMHLQGKVKVLVTIAADGRVTGTKVIGGHPVLAVAAVEALKRWRFEPGPKETTEIIEMNFGDNEN